MGDEAALDRSEFYNWFKQRGLRYFVGSALPHTKDHFVMWSLQRTEKQGHVQRADVDLFEILNTHMAQAVRTASTVGSLTSHRKFGSAVMDALPQAVFALSCAGTILFTNKAAGSLIAEADGLRATNGVLEPHHRSKRGELRRMIHEAGRAGVEANGGWMRLPRRSGKSDYSVLVAPLVSEEVGLIGSSATVLVLVHDPARKNLVSVRMLQQVHGLTAAESRIVTALAAGHSVATISKSLEISASTTRTHLKSIFRKLGVNRQQDVVRVLASAAGPMLQ